MEKKQKFLNSKEDKSIMKLGNWFLAKLNKAGNSWSIGTNGPRVYLTCDEDTAVRILRAMEATYNK